MPSGRVEEGERTDPIIFGPYDSYVCLKHAFINRTSPYPNAARQKPKIVCDRIVTIIAVFRSKTHPETNRSRTSAVEDPRPEVDTHRKQLKCTFLSYISSFAPSNVCAYALCFYVFDRPRRRPRYGKTPNERRSRYTVILLPFSTLFPFSKSPVNPRICAKNGFANAINQHRIPLR